MTGIKESISTDEIINKISKYVELAIKKYNKGQSWEYDVKVATELLSVLVICGTDPDIDFDVKWNAIMHKTGYNILHHYKAISDYINR
jgi:hypothetical protein